MIRFSVWFIVLLVMIVCEVSGQNIYELRKLTEEDWLNLTTEDRLNALGTGQKQAQNQTFLGDFGHFYDLRKRWGYDFYEMEDRYENYSFRNFENYEDLEQRRLRWSYNEFGDRLEKMTPDIGYIWQEKYYSDGRFGVRTPGGYINSVSYGFVDGVWLAKESTEDWAISLIGAGALRTHYTPLTLGLPNIDGMRIDFQSANNQLSIVNSSLLGSKDWTPTRGFQTLGSAPELTELHRRGGVLLRGGTFRRKFGALNVGTTYVTQYSVQGNRQNGDDWYGTVSNYTPTPMIVALRIMDDSPEDGEGGPMIKDVRLRVNGEYRDDIQPEVILDDVRRERTTAVTKVVERDYLNPRSMIQIGSPAFDFLKLDAQVPKYVDYFYLSEMVNGSNQRNLTSNVNVDLLKQYYTLTDPGKPVQVNGTQYAVYWFDISSVNETVRRVEAELTVSNDYRIDTTQVYTTDPIGGNDTQGRTNYWYDATYWKTMAQAEGNVKDGSNTKRLTLDFGVQVASIIYGVDFDFNYRGFQMRGEYVTNSNHYMFPDDIPGHGYPEGVIGGQAPRKGHQWAVNDNAYYFVMNKDWERFGFSGELFKMGRFYRPYLDYFYTGATSQMYHNNTSNQRNNTVRFPFVDDNDDNDQYPDTMTVTRGMGYLNIGAEDIDGVFPGNDADNDGIPDNNKNNNGLPDYYEDFLMFDSDPDEFVFGNDYNNNTVPDFREDDMKMDLPYDLDRQGYHFYLRYSPIKSISLFVGSMRTKGVGLSNRTNDDYLKIQLNYNVFDVGKIYAEYRYESIYDNISDKYIRVSNEMNTDYFEVGGTSERFERELYYDELEYKNSRVNRFWLNSVLRAVPSLTLENHFKMEKNHQIEGMMYDNTYQPDEEINTLAMLNKIVYTKSWGNWSFSPGVKYRFYKKDRMDKVRINDFYLYQIPLFMMKYTISPKSNIMLGLQGFQGFELDYTDYVQSENDFKKTSYTIQLQNRTIYFGYQIWSAVGIKYDKKMFKEDFRKFEDYKTSSTFVNVNLGW